MTTRFTYEERQAITVLRRSVGTKPEIIQELLKDASYAAAVTALRGAQKELTTLLEVCRTFQEAAASLAKLQQKDKE